MNGKRYLLDTNAFIQLLSGNDSVRAIIGGADGENQAWLKISRIRPLRRMNFWYNNTQQTIGRRIQDVHHG